METTIREFVNSFNYSSIPVGPQADLLEEIEQLNGQVPYEFRPGQVDGYNGRLYSERGFPASEFGVTKKFTWNRGTAIKFKAIKDYYDGVFLRKNYSVGSIKNLWERPHSRRYNYSHKRFKDQVYRVDNMLMDKRSNGAIWLNDGAEVDGIMDGLKNNICKSFTDFEDYVNKTPGIKCKCSTVYHEVGRDDQEKINVELDYLLNQMWQPDNTDSHIMFVRYLPDSASRNEAWSLRHSKAIILHQYPELMMNVFHGDSGTVPVFKFPVGKVIVSTEITMETLVRYSLGQTNLRGRGGYYNGHPIRTWHRPEINGLRHPYINIGNGIDHRDVPMDSCIVHYSQSGNNCAGNMRFDEPIKKLSFVGWSEETYTWVNTYRIGTTYPLNELPRAFYGNPIVLDPDLNDIYLDTVGWSADRCHNHLGNNLALISTREGMPDVMSICQSNCNDEMRNSCTGHQSDLRRIEIEKVEIAFKEPTWQEATIISHRNFEIEPPPDDVLNHLSIAEEDDISLEASMLSWINQQTRGER